MCMTFYTAQWCSYASHCIPGTRRELRRRECPEVTERDQDQDQDQVQSRSRGRGRAYGECALGIVEGPTFPGDAVDMCEACDWARNGPVAEDVVKKPT